MGETIERYCASIKSVNSQNICQKSNMVNKINIDSITRASTKFDNIPNREWSVVEDVLSKEKVLIPSEMVYLNKTNYPPIRDIISTGLAAFSTLQGAIIHGLCECIERDAFVLFWMLGYGRFKIDINTIEEIEIKILLNKAYHAGLKVDIYDISTEFDVPVILTIIKKENSDGFYVACAANFNYGKAIRKALEEGLGGYSIYVEATLLHNIPIPDSLENPKDLSERPIYYLNNKKDYLLDSLIKCSGMLMNVKKYPSIEKEEPRLEQVINRIRERNINVFFKDLTTTDVREIGFKVVRVIMPELAFLSTGSPMLHCERLTQKSRELNRKINMEPHPFP